MKIGILGGTFNPVHRGHIAMARAAIQAREIDEVLLIPAFQPPHKKRVETTAEDRLEMVRIATRDEPKMRASDLEIRRGGVSYTVDTLETLRRSQPGAELFFIIGEDSLAELPLWRDLPGILERASILTLTRPGHTAAAFSSERFPNLSEATLRDCEANRIPMEPVPVASRTIRQALREGKNPGDELPPGVQDYIRKKGLYRN